MADVAGGFVATGRVVATVAGVVVTAMVVAGAAVVVTGVVVVVAGGAGAAVVGLSPTTVLRFPSSSSSPNKAPMTRRATKTAAVHFAHLGQERRRSMTPGL